MAKLKISHKQTDGTLVDQYVRPVNDDGVQEGGTGGAGSNITSTGVATIACSYSTSAGTGVEYGYIVAQKGSHKHLVANANAVGTSQTVCTLANVTGNTTTIIAGLSASQMAITFYPPTGSGSDQLAATRITNKFVYDFAGNKYRYKLGGNATATFANVATL